MDRIVTYFERQPHIVAVILFGSRAKQKARPDSDWDIAVLRDPQATSTEELSLRLSWMADLEEGLGGPVEIVFLNEAGPVLRRQILSTGKPVYVRDRKALVRFKARTWIDYMDWQPYQARLDRAVRSYFRKTA